MLKTLTIEKPGKSKIQLLRIMESQYSNFKDLIKENNTEVEKIQDGFKINFERKILFRKFFLDASIIADEEKFLIEYDTNAPEFKVREFESKAIEFLESL